MAEVKMWQMCSLPWLKALGEQSDSDEWIDVCVMNSGTQSTERIGHTQRQRKWSHLMFHSISHNSQASERQNQP